MHDGGRSGDLLGAFRVDFWDDVVEFETTRPAIATGNSFKSGASCCAKYATSGCAAPASRETATGASTTTLEGRRWTSRTASCGPTRPCGCSSGRFSTTNSRESRRRRGLCLRVSATRWCGP